MNQRQIALTREQLLHFESIAKELGYLKAEQEFTRPYPSRAEYINARIRELNKQKQKYIKE